MTPDMARITVRLPDAPDTIAGRAWVSPGRSYTYDADPYFVEIYWDRHGSIRVQKRFPANKEPSVALEWTEP
jgi:hypothetical protein